MTDNEKTAREIIVPCTASTDGATCLDDEDSSCACALYAKEIATALDKKDQDYPKQPVLSVTPALDRLRGEMIAWAEDVDECTSHTYELEESVREICAKVYAAIPTAHSQAPHGEQLGGAVHEAPEIDIIRRALTGLSGEHPRPQQRWINASHTLLAEIDRLRERLEHGVTAQIIEQAEERVRELEADGVTLQNCTPGHYQALVEAATEWEKASCCSGMAEFSEWCDACKKLLAALKETR